MQSQCHTIPFPEQNPPSVITGDAMATSAEETLGVIRNLMERATLYQALSAPAAAAASVLAFAAGSLVPAADPAAFLTCWAIVLVLANSINALILAGRARQVDEPFLSSGLKHTFRRVALPLFAGAALGTAAALSGQLQLAAAIWLTAYGLALHATATYAPPALGFLGTACAITGTTLAVLLISGLPLLPAQAIMALGFGIPHLVYATLTAKNSIA